MEYYFENKEFTGNDLLKLNPNNMLYYHEIYRFLPIMNSIKFQEIIRQLQGNYNNFFIIIYNLIIFNNYLINKYLFFKVKTIYIQDYNYEGEIKDKFYKLKIHNDKHLKNYLDYLSKGFTLKPINNNSKKQLVGFRSFKKLRNDRYYRIV